MASVRSVAADSGRGRGIGAIMLLHCTFSDLRRKNRVGGGSQLSGKTFLRSGSGPGLNDAKGGLEWAKHPAVSSEFTAFVCQQLNSKQFFVLHASN